MHRAVIERRERVMEIARRYGRINAARYRAHIPFYSKPTITWDFSSLCKAGRLRKVGTGKGAYYVPVW